MKKPSELRAAFLGSGPKAEPWAAALRGRAAICARDDPSVDALVIAPGSGDPFARAKEALLNNVPVLFAAPFLLSPWQATVLHEMGGGQDRLLRFAELYQHRPGFSFLQRLLEGAEPFWQPMYVRSLCTGRPDGAVHIDELATEELAICDNLVGGTPQQVTAQAARYDAVSDVNAVFIAVQYAGGPLVQCTISLAEATASRQLVAVTPDRTAVLDELDPTAPVRIIGPGAHELCPQRAAAPNRQRHDDWPAGATRREALDAEVEHFLHAVTTGDRSAANGERWVRVAGLWWAARQSMAFGSPADMPQTAGPAGDSEPPPLRVIQGGGNVDSTTRRRPALAVVAR